MLKRIFKTKKGQGMTEYILIIALIALAVFAAVSTFGNKIKESFNKATEAVAIE